MDHKEKALRPGTVLYGASEYRIERVLGAGGFGITYLASTTFIVGSIRVKGQVAIKEHFMGDHCEREFDTGSVTCPGTEVSRTIVGNSLKDFKAEARRLAEYGKDHPNIVKVNEIFEANGTAYYVMEYLDGHSLADYIAANGPLDEEHIRAFVFPVVDAVSFLHNHRLTHLDIKPGNIMLATNEDGSVRPVLIDFGLSKHYNADGSATSTVNTMACSDGFSPNEQYSGIRTFSPTADVYALGATMYSAAIGSIPTVSTEWSVGEPAATIATLPLPERLRTVMTRAMAPYKYDRYADAGAMLAALGGRSDTGKVPSEPETEHEPEDPGKTDLITSEPTPQLRVRNLRKPVLYGAIAIIVLIAAVFIYIAIGNNNGGVDPQQLNQMRTPHNLDLAVKRGGETYYYNRWNWNDSIYSGDEKLGVVIIKDGQRFILSLTCTEKMTWNEAMERYGNVLPTKAQGEAMASQYEAVNAAIRNYGGTVPSLYNEYWFKTEDLYWTKTECDSSNALIVNMTYGYVNDGSKAYTYRVRAVAPVPES